MEDPDRPLVDTSSKQKKLDLLTIIETHPSTVALCVGLFAAATPLLQDMLRDATPEVRSVATANPRGILAPVPPIDPRAATSPGLPRDELERQLIEARKRIISLEELLRQLEKERTVPPDAPGALVPTIPHQLSYPSPFSDAVTSGVRDPLAIPRYSRQYPVQITTRSNVDITRTPIEFILTFAVASICFMLFRYLLRQIAQPRGNNS